MKTYITLGGYALSFVLLMVIFFMKSCTPTPKGQVKIITKPADTVTKTRTVTVFKPVQVYVPTSSVTHVVTKFDTIFIPAPPLSKPDTIKAVKDFYLTKFYKDTFTLQSCYVQINTKVSQNKIIGANYSVSNKRLTAEVNKTAKIRIYVGAQAGWSTGLNTPLFSPMIAVQNQRDNIIFGSYDVFHQTYQLGSLIKIHIGK